MMLQGMGGAVLGVWAAHGEGQALFPREEVREQVLARGLGPIRCVAVSLSRSILLQEVLWGDAWKSEDKAKRFGLFVCWGMSKPGLLGSGLGKYRVDWVSRCKACHRYACHWWFRRRLTKMQHLQFRT